jgi:hypothetical protein
LLASHSATVLSRIEPTSVRHFRLDQDTAAATVRPIELPEDDNDAAKFIREAVHAHPELYFSRFVVLGEGDTEELVIPRIARARGVDLDPSFVAMVPLGGRHTNHFWRLLRGLDIPHTLAQRVTPTMGVPGSAPRRDERVVACAHPHTLRQVVHHSALTAEAYRCQASRNSLRCTGQLQASPA